MRKQSTHGIQYMHGILSVRPSVRPSVHLEFTFDINYINFQKTTIGKCSLEASFVMLQCELLEGGQCGQSRYKVQNHNKTRVCVLILRYRMFVGGKRKVKVKD